MTAYIGTSALVRLVLRESGALESLQSYDALVSSELIADPLPLPLGTLDALHLATALTCRDRIGPLPVMATHDEALGLAARAFGFDVVGLGGQLVLAGDSSPTLNYGANR